MTLQDNAQVVLDLYEAFNKREIAHAASTLIADSVEWVSVPFGTTFHGPEGYRQFVEGWATAMPDSTVDVTRVIVNGDSVVTEFTGRGTHTGPFITPAGEIPPTGRQVELQFCEVLQLRDGKVARGHSYFDSTTVLRQLGLIP
ncbi:MAG TPA: ester cyclase [Chloroflexia bacterium]|nr:ester cyclase [Chloroflexia bacterium]